MDKLLKNPLIKNTLKLKSQTEIELMTTIEQILNETAKKFKSTNATLSKDAIEIGSKVINGMVCKILEDKNLNVIYVKCFNENRFLFKHQVVVSWLSLVLAQSYCERHHKPDVVLLEICVLSGLLHDLGLMNFPDEVIYSEYDFDIKNHVHNTVQMIEKISFIKDEVRFVLKQCHENNDGSGYPDKLTSDFIFQPAKILRIADEITSLICNRNSELELTPVQAIAILSRELPKYDFELMRIMSDLVKHYTLIEEQKAA